MSKFGHLPPDIARHCVLSTKEAAAFAGYSVPHWRRLYWAKVAPTPLKLGVKKLGWKVGDLAGWLETRRTA